MSEQKMSRPPIGCVHLALVNSIQYKQTVPATVSSATTLVLECEACFAIDMKLALRWERILVLTGRRMEVLSDL